MALKDELLDISSRMHRAHDEADLGAAEGSVKPVLLKYRVPKEKWKETLTEHFGAQRAESLLQELSF